jgi:hypothetical protein
MTEMDSKVRKTIREARRLITRKSIKIWGWNRAARKEVEIENTRKTLDKTENLRSTVKRRAILSIMRRHSFAQLWIPNWQDLRGAAGAPG